MSSFEDGVRHARFVDDPRGLSYFDSPQAAWHPIASATPRTPRTLAMLRARLSTFSALFAAAAVAGGVAGALDALFTSFRGGAFSVSLFVTAISLGALLAAAGSLPLILGLALFLRPRSSAARLGVLVGALAVSPGLLALGKVLYHRIPWHSGDLALGVAGLLAPIAALALFAKLGSLLGPARGASLAKILVRLFIPACLLLIPASVRIARGFSPPRAERDGDPELSSLLLLSVDTLRADGIGCLGNPSTRTPSLDRLSRTSRVQIECIAPSPWTLPSLASVLTGTYPGEHHVLEEISGIAPSVATIAEICAANGRRTAAFVSNPWLATGNFARGFDVFDVAERLDCFHDASCSRLVQTLTKTVLRLARLDSAEAISARALAWLRGGSGSFFLWLHYFDPHLPNWPARPYDRLFGPPPRFARSSLRFEEIREGRFPGDAAGRAEIERLYYGEVAYTDRAIGRVLRSLEEDGTLRKTSVVFCADHGEEFWDHDDYGHGHSMFEEVVRVPLFARIPDSRSGELDAGLAGLVDVAPTATALLGIENVETRAFSGESLLTHEPVSPEDIRAASISSSATTGVARRAFLYGEGMLYGAEQKLLRGEKWKLVLETPQEKAPPRLRLYDLQSDPSERTDLVMARADVADSLLVELEHWMARVGSAGTAAVREGVGLDPSIRALLQSLGYIAD